MWNAGTSRLAELVLLSSVLLSCLFDGGSSFSPLQVADRRTQRHRPAIAASGEAPPPSRRRADRAVLGSRRRTTATSWRSNWNSNHSNHGVVADSFALKSTSEEARNDETAILSRDEEKEEAKEEEEEEEGGGYDQPVLSTHGEDDDDDEPSSAYSSSDRSSFSRAKWKKKRYWMLKDVAERIRIGDRQASRKAEEAVRRMRTLYARTGHAEYLPDVEAYNLWIHALAKVDGDGERAESVLRSMTAADDDRTRVEPNVVTYTSVMDAYANTPSPDSAQNTERIMWELLEISERRERLMPDQLAAGGQKSGGGDDDDDEWKVTSVTSDTVLNAFAKRGTWDAASRAEDILRRLEAYSDEYYGDESTVRANRAPSALRIRPTEHSYATVIHGWATCRGGRPAAVRAQNILSRMLQRVREKGDRPAVAPDTVIFNAVMDSWGKSGDPQAGSKALALLNLMQKLHVEHGYDTRPDVVSYNTVLSAWSHSGHVNAAEQAEKVLREMQLAHRQAPDTSPAPNTVSYNSVLHALGQSKHNDVAADTAEALLNYMLTAREGQEAAPDVYSFTSVLNAVAKSKDPDKACRARDWLDRLIQLQETDSRWQRRSSLQLSQVPFNAVLNACAFSALGTTDEQQRQALQIAVHTFQRMRQEFNIAPDTVSYGNMIKCVANVMPSNNKRRSDMALQLFDKCCQDGLVGELVWNEIRKVVAAKILQDRLRSFSSKSSNKPVGKLRVRDLPLVWCRNLRDRRFDSVAAERRSQQQRRKEEAQSTKQQELRRKPVQKLRNINEPSYQSGRDL